MREQQFQSSFHKNENEEDKGCKEKAEMPHL